MTTTTVQVRDVQFQLHTYNRSLALCARMNYETENLDFIDSIPAGSVFYDLGACEGRFAIYAACKGFDVYAFEPDPDNYQVLVDNIRLNNLDQLIHPLPMALGDRVGDAALHIAQPWSGGHQKVIQYHDYRRDDLNFDFQRQVNVELQTLDNLVFAEGYPMPDYLKVDIDGSELPFLQGAERVLADRHLAGLMFELFIADPEFPHIQQRLLDAGLSEQQRYLVPNEAKLYNIMYRR